MGKWVGSGVCKWAERERDMHRERGRERDMHRERERERLFIDRCRNGK
jgi:hypothetical protein